MKSTQTKALTRTTGGFFPMKKSLPRATNAKLQPISALANTTIPIITALSSCVSSAGASFVQCRVVLKMAMVVNQLCISYCKSWYFCSNKIEKKLMNIITKWPSGLVYSAPERPKWLAGTKCRRFDLSSLSSLYNPVFPSSLSTAVAGEMPRYFSSFRIRNYVHKNKLSY